MIIKTGHGEIIDVMKEDDARVDDSETHCALEKVKKDSSNKTESTVTDINSEAEKN